MTGSQQSPFANEEYTVGWICALPIELAAAKGMLDEVHGEPQTPPVEADNNIYVLGSMGKFKVVVACLPMHQLGIPDYDNDQDIRLGDVVISSHPENGGVVVYDFGKRLADGSFHSLSALNRPPRSLGSALGKLKAEHEMRDNEIPQYIEEMLERYPVMRKKGYSHPGQSSDQLFQSSYPHTAGRTCAKCDPSQEVHREPRLDEIPVIHYGTIASGNVVVNDASMRQEIREKYGAICLEMEAAGLMNNFPCLVIRGISEYADSHKNDRWQPFAVATAAACAKEFLTHVQPKAIDREPAAKDILSRVYTEVSELKSLCQDMKASHISSNIRDWLSAPDVTVNHNAACLKHHTRTGQWFINGHHFISWLEKPNSFLWINGFAGCGKSVLCSTAIEEVFRKNQDEQRVGIAFFYFDFNDTSKQNDSGLLRALLLQLSGQLKDGEKDLEQLYLSSKSDTQVLLTHLQRIVQRFHNTYILLDALDESPRYRQRENVLTVLETMREWRLPTLHLFVTSRDELDIRQSLNPTSDQDIIMKNAEIDSDIASFVSYQLAIEPKLQRWKERHPEIQAALTERAQGIFRYAECQFNALKRARNRNHLDACLHSLPRDLDETYERLLCSIDAIYVEDVRRILMMLCFSSRPLTVAELIHAHAVDLGEPPCVDLNGRLLQKDDLRDICLGLIEIVRDNRREEEILIVHIAHFSVQEYLVSDRIQRQKSAIFALKPEASHTEIVQICLAYLLDLMFSNDETNKMKLRDFPFLTFAADYWFHHYKNTSHENIRVRNLIRKLFSNERNSFQTRLHNMSNLCGTRLFNEGFYGRDPNIASPIYYGSVLGLDWLLHEMLSVAPKGSKTTLDLVNTRGGTHCYPLHAASNKGHGKVVQMLLDHGADIDAMDGQCSSALHTASSNGHEKVVQILLDQGAVDYIENGGYDALGLAAWSGHEKVVQVLLDHGADVNATYPRGYYSNILTGTVYRGYDKDMVMKVVPLGTSLNIAVFRGHERIVQILLDHGADVNAHGDRLTALQIASGLGHERIVQILLDHGADVNLQGGLSQSALPVSSIRAYLNYVKMLRANGAMY